MEGRQEPRSEDGQGVETPSARPGSRVNGRSPLLEDNPSQHSCPGTNPGPEPQHRMELGLTFAFTRVRDIPDGPQRTCLSTVTPLGALIWTGRYILVRLPTLRCPAPTASRDDGRTTQPIRARPSGSQAQWWNTPPAAGLPVWAEGLPPQRRSGWPSSGPRSGLRSRLPAPGCRDSARSQIGRAHV